MVLEEVLDQHCYQVTVGIIVYLFHKRIGSWQRCLVLASVACNRLLYLWLQLGSQLQQSWVICECFSWYILQSFGVNGLLRLLNRLLLLSRSFRWLSSKLADIYCNGLLFRSINSLSFICSFSLRSLKCFISLKRLLGCTFASFDIESSVLSWWGRRIVWECPPISFWVIKYHFRRCIDARYGDHLSFPLWWWYYLEISCWSFWEIKN